MLRHYAPPPPRRWATPAPWPSPPTPQPGKPRPPNLIDHELVALADGGNERLMVFMPPQEEKGLS